MTKYEKEYIIIYDKRNFTYKDIAMIELKKELNEILNVVKTTDVREFYKRLANDVNPKMSPKHEKYFAKSLSEIDPYKIKPDIEIVESKEQRELFKSAISFWSVPISAGYGRRINVILWDRYHNKVMAIAGLNDPVIGMELRDKFIGWNKCQRHERLYNLMTAYVLGAVEPYNQLLGAKLIAMLIGSKEITDYFTEKYKDKETIIRKRKPIPKLVAIDTMGAFGQSAIYHSLKEWKFIGYTQGRTHYHLTLNGFWEKALEIAKQLNLNSLQKNVYGNGANWKFRVLNELFHILKIDDDVFETGHRRGYYFRPLVANWKEFLTGQTNDVIYQNKTKDEYIEFWKEKFLYKRVKKLGG